MRWATSSPSQLACSQRSLQICRVWCTRRHLVRASLGMPASCCRTRACRPTCRPFLAWACATQRHHCAGGGRFLKTLLCVHDDGGLVVVKVGCFGCCCLALSSSHRHARCTTSAKTRRIFGHTMTSCSVSSAGCTTCRLALAHQSHSDQRHINHSSCGQHTHSDKTPTHCRHLAYTYPIHTHTHTCVGQSQVAAARCPLWSRMALSVGL